MTRSFHLLAVTALLILGTKASAVGPIKPVSTIPVRADDARRDCQWLAFSPSGRFVAIRRTTPDSKVGRLEVFEAATEKSIASVAIEGGHGVRGERVSCAFAPDDSWIAYGEGEELRFLALAAEGAKLPGNGRLKGARAGPNATAVWFSVDGTTAFFDP